MFKQSVFFSFVVICSNIVFFSFILPQLEVYRPLINLVDNMVTMGSLYGGDNLMLATQYRKVNFFVFGLIADARS